MGLQEEGSHLYSPPRVTCTLPQEESLTITASQPLFWTHASATRASQNPPQCMCRRAQAHEKKILKGSYQQETTTAVPSERQLKEIVNPAQHKATPHQNWMSGLQFIVSINCNTAIPESLPFSDYIAAPETGVFLTKPKLLN